MQSINDSEANSLFRKQAGRRLILYRRRLSV